MRGLLSYSKTDGRIFALSGSELIEGRIAEPGILEVQRLNIALTPPPRLASIEKP